MAYRVSNLCTKTTIDTPVEQLHVIQNVSSAEAKIENMIDVFAGFEFPTRTAPDTSSRRIPRIVKDSSHDGVAFVDLVDLGDHRVDLFLGPPLLHLDRDLGHTIFRDPHA